MKGGLPTMGNPGRKRNLRLKGRIRDVLRQYGPLSSAELFSRVIDQPGGGSTSVVQVACICKVLSDIEQVRENPSWRLKVWRLKE